MAVGVKIASESFSTTELVFYRGIVSLIFMTRGDARTAPHLPPKCP
jgi:hypothetical protein